MNYQLLKYIVTVAEEESFTKAAKKLFISQPSLSQIIKSEEERIGMPLFDRKSNPISLTNLGRRYILWAKQILELFNNMEKSLQDARVNESFLLEIAILPELTSLMLPEALKIFRKKYPKGLVKIYELSSNELKASLEDLDLDFVIGLTHPDKFTYTNIALYDETIVLASNLDYQPYLSEDGKVNLAEFSDLPFIMMEEGQFLYNTSHTLCKRAGFVPKTIVECYNLETAMHLIKAGVGISIIPDLMIHLVGDLNYYNLEGIMPKSQISITYKNDQYLSDKAKELIDIIRDKCLTGF